MRILKLFLIILLLLVTIAGMVAVAVIRQGFRATSVPSVSESVFARTLRNLAIPRSERNARNPFEETAESLNEGRGYFLSHCALCHGVDGGGKTQVGLNLYPRAPDLRQAATQNLTDGEIHYIIENGVQRTGMPAWGNPHSESFPDSWKLVVFIRSLRRLSRTEQGQQRFTVASDHDMGSESCEKCHAEIYRRWKKTPMANVVREPSRHPDAIIPDLATNNVAKFTRDQVAFVYGSLWKQRYFTKINDDYFPLAVQWDVRTHTWLPYKVPQKGGDWWGAVYPQDNMQRPTGPLCDGCHSVGYDIETKQVAEWNVGCERCHGPGSEHVAHPSRGNILNPSHLDDVAANDICIQCHSQGQPRSNPIQGKYYDWPVGYNVGLRLQDFWKLEDCVLGETNWVRLFCV
jgi:Cytochrome C oxidase, cbb3-type, subunit III/Cytochrome c554 and c-prime